MATEYKPVKLTRNGKNRVARSAAEETKLRFDGWHSLEQIAPEDRNKAEVRAGEPNKPKAEPAPKKS